MLFLLILFGLSTIGMLAVPLRYAIKIHATEEDSDMAIGGDENSIARVRIVGLIDRFETWYQHSAKNSFLKLLDRVLGVFERGAGKIAGHTKSTRLLIQERFRVIPRESMYWKHIRTWKKTNGTHQAVVSIESEEYDISNHSKEE